MNSALQKAPTPSLSKHEPATSGTRTVPPHPPTKWPFHIKDIRTSRRAAAGISSRNLHKSCASSKHRPKTRQWCGWTSGVRPGDGAAMAPDTQRFEVLIVGGGMAGLTLGCTLATAGVAVAVADRLDPATVTDEGFDGRTTAIAYGSARVLEGAGIWPLLVADAPPIPDIRLADGHPRPGVSTLFPRSERRRLGEERVPPCRSRGAR